MSTLPTGLSVHMNQVHKETLNCVENALPSRQGLDVEIFGMEGVPEEIIQQHNQRIIQNFYTAQAERQAATGNPPRGSSGSQRPTKKIKYETPEEIKKRLAEHRAKLAAQKAAGANGVPGTAAPANGPSPAQGVSFRSYLCLSRLNPFQGSTHTPRSPTRRHHSLLRSQATPTPHLRGAVSCPLTQRIRHTRRQLPPSRRGPLHRRVR